MSDLTLKLISSGKEKKTWIVSIPNILFYKCHTHYIDVYFISKEHHIVVTIYNSMREMEILLADYPFVRTHNAYMANESQISFFTKKYAQVGSYKVPIARNRFEEVEKYLLERKAEN